MKRTSIFIIIILCLCAVGSAYAAPAYISDKEYHSEKPPILIEGAMAVETDFLIANIKNPVSYRAGAWSYTAGELDDYPVVICRTRAGMINAAAATTLGIELFRPAAVINQGTAGGHDPELHRGDIIIAKSSFNAGAWQSKARKKGEGIDYNDIELLGKTFYDIDGAGNGQVYLYSDTGLLAAAQKVKDSYKEGRVVLGIISTQDDWERQTDRILWLHEKFGSSAEEMETYAAASICQDYNVPFLGIRILSNSEPNKEAFDPQVAVACQEFTLNTARQYIKTKLTGDRASAPEDALKIAVICTGTHIHDDKFVENNYNGVLNFIQQHPDASVTALEEPTGDVQAALRLVDDIAAYYDVIVCCDYKFSGIAETALKNPKTRFILVETWPSDKNGNEVELENVYAMLFKEQESGFLAGMAAALCSKTKKVAVVTGVAYAQNLNYQYGFMSGVNYANQRYKTGVEIVELPLYAGIDASGLNTGGNCVGSFMDTAKGKEIGQALIKAGCDIIFVAADGSGKGVFDAVKEAEGVYVIGCDVDQYDDGFNGNSNIVLTSVLKVMDVNDTRFLNEILNGTFKGGNYLLDANTDSTGYVSKAGRCQLSDDVIKKLDNAFAMIKTGAIVPASAFNGMKPDNFKGIDAE